MTFRQLLADRAAAPLLATGFARLARRRRGEPVHHHGLALAGELEIAPRAAAAVGAVLLDRPGRYRVRARLSWGLGRGGLPDVAGLALRVLDADGRGDPQDLLLDGSRPAPHDRVLVLRRDLAGWYGSPLRLRAGGVAGPKVQVAVRIAAGPAGRLTLAGARAAAAAGRLHGVLVAHDAGRLLATGRLRLDEVADDPGHSGPRFDVDVTGGGLVGTGFWHLLRQRSYTAARVADPRLLGRDEHPERDVDHDLRARQQAGQQEQQPDTGR